MNIKGLLGKPWTVPVVGIAGLSAGFSLGYLFARRYPTVTFWKEQEVADVVFLATVEDIEEQRPTDELDRRQFTTVESRQEYVEKAKEQGIEVEWADDREDGDELFEGLVFDQSSRPVEVIVDEPIRTNIFQDVTDPEWDYDEEVKNRGEELPYIIHIDEFFGKDFEDDVNSTLTYYEGDDILTDEDDTPIYNYVRTIGELKWGHGSGDPLVFYSRNPKTGSKFEVVRHTGSYAQEVLGVSIEEEAHRGAPKDTLGKFRPSD